MTCTKAEPGEQILECSRLVVRDPGGKGGRIEMRASEGNACIILTGPKGEHYPNVEIGLDGENAGLVIMDRDPRAADDLEGARIRAEVTLDRHGTATLAVTDGKGYRREIEAACPLTEAKEQAREMARCEAHWRDQPDKAEYLAWARARREEAEARVRVLEAEYAAEADAERDDDEPTAGPTTTTVQ